MNSWQKNLQKFQEEKEWDDAIELLINVINQNREDKEEYLILLSLFMNLVDEIEDQIKRDYYENSVKKYFEILYSKFKVEKLEIIIQKIEVQFSKKNLNFDSYIFLNEINNIFSKIKTCKTPLDADHYFDILQEANDFRGKLSYLKEIDVGKSLWEFCREFDRVDAKEEQKYLFNKIKYHNYVLDQHTENN